ncbi:MAG: calcium:proton antiporter, partial [Pseudomonadota bacterium]|nr:calcium:proton antiporter [Pseudomonadota bacterium]
MSAMAGFARVTTLARSEARLLAGLATVAVFHTIGQHWLGDLSHPVWNAVMFAWLFAAMAWCTFGVLHHADAVAVMLGEPYGTLILTIAVVTIEVTMMATVMFSGLPNPTLPRDTMFASLMIVLNGVAGLSLTTGALRYGQQDINLQGATAYIAIITTLSVLALILPKFTTSVDAPAFTAGQAVVFAVLSLLLYISFLVIQTVRHSAFFREPDVITDAGPGANTAGIHVPTLVLHAVLLCLSLMTVVLLSQSLSQILNHAIEDVGLPVALGGIVIAIMVLMPE